MKVFINNKVTDVTYLRPHKVIDNMHLVQTMDGNKHWVSNSELITKPFNYISKDKRRIKNMPKG